VFSQFSSLDLYSFNCLNEWTGYVHLVLPQGREILNSDPVIWHVPGSDEVGNVQDKDKIEDAQNTPVQPTTTLIQLTKVSYSSWYADGLYIRMGDNGLVVDNR
jgi:hypothetical protein